MAYAGIKHIGWISNCDDCAVSLNTTLWQTKLLPLQLLTLFFFSNYLCCQKTITSFLTLVTLSACVQVIALQGAETRIWFGAAGLRFWVFAGSHRARDRVAGTGGILQGLLWNDLLQGMLLLYLEDVWLVSLILTDTKKKKTGFS